MNIMLRLGAPNVDSHEVLCVLLALAARKKVVAALLVKQRSVAHSVHLSADGCSSAPAGTRADVVRGSSREATWLDTVISACTSAQQLSGVKHDFAAYLRGDAHPQS